jgi:hypothetical protein
VCEFLVSNNANVNYVNDRTGETLLHILAQAPASNENITGWARSNINRFELNAQDSENRFLCFIICFKLNNA